MGKRLFDIVVSSLAILLGLPLWLVVAIAIKLDSPGSVFYKGIRVGKGGTPFRIYKFRTMTTDADRHGSGITRDGDPRITRVGRFLRRYKIDEMPQVINVLKGDMSIIGPRPEDPRYVAHYTPEQRRVLEVRPGMASPAFIKYRYEEELLASTGENMELIYLTKILPDKLRLDLDYVERRSFLYDLYVFFCAAFSILAVSGRGKRSAALGGKHAAQ